MKSLATTKYGADRHNLLQIYNSLIKGKISYSSPLLVSTSQTNLDILEIIQNTALRIATGAIRTTEIASLQCEANIPPLDMYLKKQAIKTYFKVQAKGQNHPIHTHTDPDEDEDLPWTEVFTHPFQNQVQMIMQNWEIPCDTQPEIINHARIPPWEPLKDYIALNLEGEETKACSDAQLRASAIQTINKRYPHALYIYTDGSKKNDNSKSTTAAFYVPENDTRISWKLHPDISIAGAEMSAIYKSTEWLLDDPPSRGDPPKNMVVILTDSKVSLHLLLQRNPKSYAVGVSEIHNNLRILRYLNWEVYFQWVPSHCGIQGNHVADALAGQAHTLETIDDYHLEIEERILRLNTAFTKTWQEKWTSEIITHPNNKLRILKEKIGHWPHTLLKSRPLDVILTRFRLGHDRLNKHLNTMKIKPSPACIQCDEGCDETSTHFFMECEAYTAHRQVLFNNLNSLGIHNPSLDILLGKSEQELGVKHSITQEVAKYIIKSQRISDL